jgi:rubredoxin
LILTENTLMTATAPYRTWMCLICGFVYDEAAGLPEEGLPPGTRWEDVPPNWACPECGARKEDFELVEI